MVGKKKFNSIGDRERNGLCKCRLKHGSWTDISQTIEHWFVECRYFNVERDEFSFILIVIIINQFSTRTTNIKTSNLNNSDNILDSNFIDNNKFSE